MRIPFWPDALKDGERGLGMKKLSLQQNSKLELGQWGFLELKSLLRKVLYLIRPVWFIGHSILSYWLGTVHGKYGFGTKVIMGPEKVTAFLCKTPEHLFSWLLHQIVCGNHKL